MKYYVLTEEQRSALLKELELEKFTAPGSMFINERSTPEQVAAEIHRRFHYVICRALES